MTCPDGSLATTSTPATLRPNGQTLAVPQALAAGSSQDAVLGRKGPVGDSTPLPHEQQGVLARERVEWTEPEKP